MHADPDMTRRIERRPLLPRRRSGMVRILSALVSFEVLFLLFFWAGRYKAMPIFAAVPVDVTVLFFGASLVAGIVVAYREVDVFKSIQDQGMVFYVLFLFWIVVTYLWSSRFEENGQKVLLTFTLLNWSFLGTYLIVSASAERARRFVIAIMVFSFAMVVYWFYVKYVMGIDIGLSSSAIVGPNYLGYGENALCLVLGLFALVLKSRTALKAFVYLLAMLAVIGAMLMIGGKGPLILALFTPMAVTLFVMFRNGMDSTLAKIVQLLLGLAVLGMLALLIMFTLGADQFETIRAELRTLDRLIGTFTQSDYGDSASSRFEAQRLALLRWFEAPFFGWGIGEYSVLDGLLFYPHNLALELLMELGLVGFLLFAGIFGLGLVRAARIWPNDLADWTTMSMCMLLFAMTISRFSFQGYLPDERFMFTLAGFVLGLGRGYQQLRSRPRAQAKGRPLPA